MDYLSLRVIFLSVLLAACSPTKKPEDYSYEFPPSTCESFNASESNSAISVCRSQVRENRFLLERQGFAEEPKTAEQSTRKFVDRALLILSVFAGASGGGDGLDSAHYQDPDRWERAANEYARSRYGPDARIQYFGEWFLNSAHSHDYESFYTFEVIPADIKPPWGEWYLKRGRSGAVEVEVLDDF